MVLGVFALLLAAGTLLIGCRTQSAVPQIIGDTTGIHQDANGEFSKETNQIFPLNPGGGFSLDHVSGRIAIHGWDGNVVAVHSVIHGKTINGVAAVNIRIDEEPNAVRVHTEMPSDESGLWILGLKVHTGTVNDATVDYEVQAPRDAQLQNITSVSGQITIDGISGDIMANDISGETQVHGAAGNLKLYTTSGQIVAEMVSSGDITATSISGETQVRGAAGNVKLDSTSGKIVAELNKLGAGQTVSLNTISGGMELAVPEDADAKFSANTLSGNITSDFPSLAVEKKIPGHTLSGSLGSGSGTVNATGVSGGLKIVKRGKP